MALLDASEIKYSNLIKKYDNFLTPVMVLKINGIDIKKIDIKVSQASVNVSIESICSASFIIEDVYDLEKSSLHTTIRNTLQLGSSVTIELGYGSSTKMVFSGYIHELSYSFSETPSISVTALDLRRLMMSNKENRTFCDKSYSDILKEVLSTYSSLYKSTKIDLITEKQQQVTQTISDYDFITKELCKKTNKEFYVLAGTVYFQEKTKNPQPLLTLTWGENLFQFEMSRKYRNEEIVVYSVDEKKISTKKEKLKSAGKLKSATTKPIRTEFVSFDVKNAKGAKTIAEAEAQKRKKKDQKGEGSCIGIPDLVPGRYINIAKLGIDGTSPVKGYLINIKHSFGSDGFVTDFTIGD